MPESCLDVRGQRGKTLRRQSAATMRKPNVHSADFLSKPFRTEIVSINRRTLTPSRSQERKTLARKSCRAFDGVRMVVLKQHTEPVRHEDTLTIFESVARYYRRAMQSRPVALRAFMIGSMLFGAASTTLAYQYLGERAAAKESVAVIENPIVPEAPKVLGATVSAPKETEDELTDTVMNDFADAESEEQTAFEAKLRDMVNGYPIEDMVPYIATKDRVIAAFLIGIAKKESAWGKRVPLYKGHDCFNYWGYRGRRRFMGTGGHTCFNSPEDAVNTVARRLEKLVYSEKRDTPAEMMTAWKCGYDCSGHSKVDTRKWISDVEMYFREVDEEG